MLGPYLPGEPVKLRGILKKVYKQMGRSILRRKMLDAGDHVMVAVSGGVDSLSLLKLFILRQKIIQIKFKITAVFVDMDFVTVDKQPLIKYFQDEGVDYVVKELKFAGQELNCFWCSWNRRKVLFETARELSCNKIAFGHHLDDIAQTILMNMFYRGEISTAPANLEMFDGELHIIRPLCDIEKADVREFAKNFYFPPDTFVCPHGKTSKREVAKKIIEDLEKDTPYVKRNIVRSLTKIKEGYLS